MLVDREYMNKPLVNTFDAHRDSKRGKLNMFAPDSGDDRTDDPPTYTEIRDMLLRKLKDAIEYGDPQRAATLEVLTNVAFTIQTFDLRARAMLGASEPDDGGPGIAA